MPTFTYHIRQGHKRLSLTLCGAEPTAHDASYGRQKGHHTPLSTDTERWACCPVCLKRRFPHEPRPT